MNLRRLITVIVGLLFLVVISLQIWFYFISLPLWRLQEVVILNNDYIPKERILAELKLEPRISIFSLNSKQIKARLSQIPQIQKVTIHRQLPATLVLEVTTKAPFLIFQIKERYWVVDTAGDILNRNDINPVLPKNICLVQGLSSIGLIKEARQDLKKLGDQINLYLDKEKIVIDYQDRNSINLYLTDKILVKIGEPVNLREKIRALYYVLEELKYKRTTVKYIDLRAERTPAVMMK